MYILHHSIVVAVKIIKLYFDLIQKNCLTVIIECNKYFLLLLHLNEILALQQMIQKSPDNVMWYLMTSACHIYAYVLYV